VPVLSQLNRAGSDKKLKFNLINEKMSEFSSADQGILNREPSWSEFWLKEDWWAVWRY